MSDKSINLAATEVRATLAGRKTTLRRPVKPQPFYNTAGKLAWITNGTMENLGRSAEEMIALHCPYGVPGDRLRVRETWARVFDTVECDPGDPFHYEYKADTGDKYPGEWPDDCGDDPLCGRWKSASTMPADASRITLEVVATRVHLLSSIGNDDLISEGIPEAKTDGTDDPWDDFFQRYEVPFMAAWNKRYGKKYPFDEDQYGMDPWVLAVTFKRIEVKI